MSFSLSKFHISLIIICVFSLSLYAEPPIYRINQEINVLNTQTQQEISITPSEGLHFQIVENRGWAYEIKIYNPDGSTQPGRFLTSTRNVDTAFIGPQLIGHFQSVREFISRASLPPHRHDCEGCEDQLEITPTVSVHSSLPSHCQVGNYDNIAECREHFVRMIMEEGRDRFATTTLDLPGGSYEVLNDALTLPDGTYINFTYQEARDIASSWGCRLPNYDQAQAIREYAERQNAHVRARTHAWDNGIHRNMTRMMNDPEMRRRAEIGQERLINGHFKWYIDDGSNNFRFYGFYAPSICRRTGYCQNRNSSGGHGRDYIDYSQSVRLICPSPS